MLKKLSYYYFGAILAFLFSQRATYAQIKIDLGAKTNSQPTTLYGIDPLYKDPHFLAELIKFFWLPISIFITILALVIGLIIRAKRKTNQQKNAKKSS